MTKNLVIFTADFMKKKILILLSLMPLLYSCGGSINNKDQQSTQAKIDSMVNAKVDSLFNRLKKQNDSIINAKANAKAQEIISAKGK